jgi:hypothetical protein
VRQSSGNRRLPSVLRFLPTKLRQDSRPASSDELLRLLVTVHIRFGTIQRRPTVTRPPQSDRSPGPEGISNCLLPLGRPGGSSYFHVPASGCARIRCRSQQHDLPINASSGRGEKVQATSDCLRKLLDTLRIRFGRIDSSEAPNTANDRADQLALSAACVDGLSLRKLLVPGLLR